MFIGAHESIAGGLYHAFAAGHDLRTDEAYDAFWGAAQRLLGLDAVRAFHLNDCKRELGSRVDRHQHVGQGTLGSAPFARLVNDARFAGLPGVVETPALPDGSSSFAHNINTLKSFPTNSGPSQVRHLGAVRQGARRANTGRI